MSDVFTAVMFVGLLFLFLIIAYVSGALDAYFKGYKICIENFDRQLMASDALSVEMKRDDFLHQPWRGTGNNQAQILDGLQGMKHR